MAVLRDLYDSLQTNWDVLASLSLQAGDLMAALKDDSRLASIQEDAQQIYRDHYEAINLSGMGPFIEGIVDGKAIEAIASGLKAFAERLKEAKGQA